MHDEVLPAEMSPVTNIVFDSNEEQLRKVLQLAGIGYWVWDLNSQALYWSPEVYTILGRVDDGSSIDINDFMAVIHEQDKDYVTQHVQQVMAEGQAPDLDYRVVRANGDIVNVYTKAAMVRDAQGVPIRLFGTLQDITQEKIQRQELRAAKELAESASRAKSDFLASMSHELRTPMNAVLGFTQLLDASLGDHALREYTREVMQAGNHLMALINDVLDLSKIEAGQLTVSLGSVDCRELINAAMMLMREFAHSRSVQLINDIRQPLSVHSDATRLKQVVLNLLSNAIKYNRSGGEVRVTVGAGTRHDTIRVLFSDTGIGIKQEHLPLLFTPFERLGQERGTEEGTGVGLAIVRHLVELMHGSVDVSSQIGVGSCFALELPRAVLTR